MKTRTFRAISWLGLLVLAGGLSIAPASDAASSQQPQMPRCSSRIGTLAVQEPQSGNAWWTSMNLESPAALIKVYVSESGCFTLVDRGKGLQAAQAERALAGEGEMRVGSNVGKGQMKAADYVLVPDIANSNSNAGGSRIGGILGGLIGHGAGAVLGGISISKKSADVVLTLTDIRSTEQVALEQGHSDKTDLGWAGGGGAFFGGFAAGGASGYANTEIGQVIAMAYLDAYTKMVADLQRNAPNARADNVQQAVRLTEATPMYSDANLKSPIVRDLKPGMMLYPTGDKVGIWWKVSDELGNIGWVLSSKLELAH
ncbi:MAG TPA: CsgG/HfaB family protein [Rhodanobacteraceae bacterium]|jgi:curli biogenesis system outer membrane secretion channel CsgG|nr:CsgG/HfaB family protein [Rhodanobacteraceae bacterium]